MVVLAAAGGVAWVIRQRMASSAEFADVRVAVLPFDTLSPTQDAREFADSLLDKILAVLTSSQVVAISRPESATFRGPQAGRAIERLGVGLLIEGTVRSDGQTLRVRVHLDDARRNLALWSREFAGPANDSEALQTDVAAHVTAPSSTTRSATTGRSRRPGR